MSEPPSKKQRSLYPSHLKTFTPPTINASLDDKPSPLSIHSSYTYLSKVPSEIKENPSDEIILGIDEAGRGPVLGLMVYAVAYCRKERLSILKENDFDDSKKLTDLKRTELFYAMCAEPGDAHVREAEKLLQPNIGYAVTNLTARDISSEMLNSAAFNNLNNQAHDTTIDLIHKILELLKGFKVTEVYIDTVGPPATYQEKLSKIFPSLKVTVSKKADSIYPIVSAASVVAKVTRDIILNKYNKLENGAEFGSGYPSDPKTTLYLKGKASRIFGWSLVIRYSWQTAKTLLNSEQYCKVIWEDDIKTKKIDYGVDVLKRKEDENGFGNLGVSMEWYGSGVSSI